MNTKTKELARSARAKQGRGESLSKKEMRAYNEWLADKVGYKASMAKMDFDPTCYTSLKYDV